MQHPTFYVRDHGIEIPQGHQKGIVQICRSQAGHSVLLYPGSEGNGMTRNMSVPSVPNLQMPPLLAVAGSSKDFEALQRLLGRVKRGMQAIVADWVEVTTLPRCRED